MYDYVEIANKVGVELDDVLDDAEDISGGNYTGNDIIYISMERTNMLVAEEIQDNLNDYINQLISESPLTDEIEAEDILVGYIDNLQDNFDPMVNALDSSFNNILDDVDWYNVDSVVQAAGSIVSEIAEDL